MPSETKGTGAKYDEHAHIPKAFAQRRYAKRIPLVPGLSVHELEKLGAYQEQHRGGGPIGSRSN